MPEEDKRPDTFGNIVALVKALVWPVVLLFIFLVYHQPFSETISSIPKLVKNATKLSAGGISLEIEQKARESGSETLANALKGLSPDARKLLLRINESSWAVWSDDSNSQPGELFSFSERPGLKELLDRGLAQFKEPSSKFDAFVKTLGKAAVDPRFKDDENGQRIVLKPSHPLTAAEIEHLKSQRFFLSDLGKKAFDVILDVVVNS